MAKIATDAPEQQSDREEPREFRPRNLTEFVGQPELVSRLRTMVATCRSRAIPFPHTLLIGPHGSGRTTLALAVASELGVNLHLVEADECERPADLAGIVNNLEAHDLLLVRNLARLRQQVTKRLAPALRDFEFHITVGEGMGARTMKLSINPFACLATATGEGDCDPHLRREFPVVLKFKPYTTDEVQLIVERAAARIGAALEPDTLSLIARTAKGSPSEAANIVRRLTNGGRVPTTDSSARELLELIGVSLERQPSAPIEADFDNIGPLDFEVLVTDLLRQMGFEATTTKASGDGGIDIEADFKKAIVGGRYLFQCKRFAADSPVGSAALREFYGALIADRKAAKGVFITTSTFTSQARQFAEGLPIELIDGDQLRALLLEHRK